MSAIHYRYSDTELKNNPGHIRNYCGYQGAKESACASKNPFVLIVEDLEGYQKNIERYVSQQIGSKSFAW